MSKRAKVDTISASDKGERYDAAFASVTKAQKSSLLDFVYTWTIQDIESIHERTNKVFLKKNNSAYHQKRRSFEILTFFMDKDFLTVPTNPLQFNRWKTTYVADAKNSIQKTKNVMIEKGIVGDKVDIKITHLVKGYKKTLEALQSLPK